MSKWVRATTVIDLRMDEGDTVQGVVNALTEGMMQASGDHTRVISLEAHEVEDA